jgi:hypothetical protein
MRASRRFPRVSGNGFALVVTLVLMVLLVLLAVALTGLASIELRRSQAGGQNAIAQANARLALILAIGQLQKNLGPDQRVSASAEILSGSPKQPHWTGAWRSTQDDGKSFFKRDDLNGGLSDQRSTSNIKPADRVMEWLVSGKADPLSGAGKTSVVLAREDGKSAVEVPKVAVKNAGEKVSGHHAWWTGDLGIRANIRSADPREDLVTQRSDPASGAWFRLMASQAADVTMMQGGLAMKKGENRKLASSGAAALTPLGKSWTAKRGFDFTVDSQGVLADTARGGLKRDLTAYFAAQGDVQPWKGLAGLSGNESLIGEPSDQSSATFRYAKSGPRFGLLRDWARLAVPFSGKNVDARLADGDEAAGKSSEALALANETPVKLAGNTRSPLQPILVEATNYTQMSTYVQSPGFYQLRQLMYPRVVLWNPYNVELKLAPAIVMMQGNGRQEMWTRTSTGSVVAWLNFEGGRNTAFASSLEAILASQAYEDPYMGSYYFSIPATTFAPGDCLVFSPAKCAEYDGLSAYRMGSYDLNKNVLSCNVAPDPGRAYYVSASDIGGGFSFLPVEFWYAPTYFFANGRFAAIDYQSDDTRAIMKSVGSTSTVTFEVFDELPQLAVLSASLQYGAGKEPRISWSKNERMPMQLLDRLNPRPTVIPNVRTRESIRLRWFDEHGSNKKGAGSLKDTPHFEEALLGNWNPRASYSMRSPWENIAGAGGPWFFGAYTRDLYDEDTVGWNAQAPMLLKGRYHGNPFGPPQEGAGRYVLFDVPRSETGVISLAQLQHGKISELVWHPSYAIANSLADPRLGTGGTRGLNRTAAVSQDSTAAKSGGFHENQLGWSSDENRAKNKAEWANTARAMLGEVPQTDNLVYDLSFEANQTLWDRYFLSSGSPEEKQRFLDDPEKQPLPNSRMKLARPAVKSEQLADFHQAASALLVDGAFNVNSTRVEAWKALLGSTRLCGYSDGKNVPFPRVIDAPGSAWKNGDNTDADAVWDGRRELTPDEIHKLATAIVDEVKLRGPFVSLADFVNRRLAENETGRMGPLQAAIEKAGLNSGLVDAYPLSNKKSLPDYKHPDNIADATRMEQMVKPESKAWGAPGWLTQADILQPLGPVLSARSDSFVIRAYGDATDSSGNITATAWCEAVVQRTPEPLDADASGINPRLNGTKGDFGRRFIITSFRWLSPEEI